MKQEINKLIGFCALTLSSGEEIPMKFGFRAVADFCEHFGIKSSEIYTRFFEWVEREVETEENGEVIKTTEQFPICNDVGNFLPAVLWCAANYVSKFEGGPGYRLIDADHWIDEIGGPGSDQLAPVYEAFFESIRIGTAPPKPSNVLPEAQEAAKKKGQSKKNR